MTTGLRLVGKTAIVTGGASGIGEAVCKLFVEHGAKVVIGDVDSIKGQALERELNIQDKNAIFCKLDVTVEKNWQIVVSKMIDTWGRLDIVVNNAGLSGVAGRATVEDITLENW